MDLIDALRSRPKTVLHISRPDVDELLGSCELPVSVRDKVEGFASSPCYTDRVAAVGLIGRLCAPETAADWSKNTPSSMLEKVEIVSLGDVDYLADQFEHLPRALARADEDLVLNALLEDRDKLESISFVLQLAGLGNVLVESLKALDMFAAKYGNYFKSFTLGKDSWLKAVFPKEPEIWWPPDYPDIPFDFD